jgi:hypothetical protein
LSPIADVQRNDDRWVALATNQFSDSLPCYLLREDRSALLANLINVTFQILVSSRDESSLGMAKASSNILETLISFNIRNDDPELQRDFLALWDQID